MIFKAASRALTRLKQIYWSYHSNKKFKARQAAFKDSGNYWENRYQEGGNSGSGSYGKYKEFKREILNNFVKTHNVDTVIEFGCGDGNQLIGAEYPNYLGVDVSQKAVEMCTDLFKDDDTKQFKTADDVGNERADLALSLDVIYHLVEDSVFESYMKQLFESAKQYVIIYSSNETDAYNSRSRHVRHRNFTDWVGSNIQDWQLVQKVPNRFPFSEETGEGSYADFYVYERSTQTAKNN